MIHTDGTWSRDEPPLYFAAANWLREMAQWRIHKNVLAALGDVSTPDKFRATVGDLKVLLDSGIFSFTNEYARKHDLTMDQVLAIAPQDMEGFDKLFNRYIEFISGTRDLLWGYIELDQGGRENKIKTRAKLEAAGLRPIPVYHPLNDGWDYFDELASGYDRICLGNVVQASQPERVRLMYTIHERRKKYPGLWIHALGVTPQDSFVGMPVNSYDSSSWMSPAQYPGGLKIRISNRSVARLGSSASYDMELDSDQPGGWQSAIRACLTDALIIQRNLRAALSEMSILDAEPAL